MGLSPYHRPANTRAAAFGNFDRDETPGTIEVVLARLVDDTDEPREPRRIGQRLIDLSHFHDAGYPSFFRIAEWPGGLVIGHD